MPPLAPDGFPNVDDREPLVLLLGNVDHEGVTSQLKSSGTNYKKKVLESGSNNWSKILGHFYGYAVRCTIVKLSTRTYELIAMPQYSGVAQELFEKIALTKHAVFVYEDFLSRQADCTDGSTQPKKQDRDPALDDDEDLDHYGGEFELRQPSTRVLETVNGMLLEHRLNVVPYRTKLRRNCHCVAAFERCSRRSPVQDLRP
jgi:hypothetical protein